MITYDMTLRKNSSLYEYLFQCIRKDIICGRLKANEKLPSKRKLADHLHISLITVTNAYEQLETEGYIYSVQRKGYFVEDLSNYVVKEEKCSLVDHMNYEEIEKKYDTDFQANRVKANMFPFSTWSKLQREIFSTQQEYLLDTVPYNGSYELRVAISEYLQRNRGMDVLPAQVIIGAGIEYLYIRLFMMFGHDFIFGMEKPGYEKIIKISKGYGIRWENIPIDEHGINVKALENSGADIIHVSPANHFPSGTIMSIKRRIELFEWANRINKRYIIEDDYDSEFVNNGKMVLPLYHTDIRDKVIYLNTFSKTLVPSLRIGYMVLPLQLLERYKETLGFYSCTVPSFEQYTLAKFITEGYFERHLSRLRKYYSLLHKAFIEELKNTLLYSNSEIIERQSGTYFCLKVKTTLPKVEVLERAEKQNVRLHFYEEIDTYDTCGLIINYANLHSEEITKTVIKLNKIFYDIE